MTRKNAAASVRQRLMTLSRALGANYNALLAQYAIERFLFRLSKSGLAADFVLKGAMLFRAWGGTLHRPTKDLDLLGFGEPIPIAVAATVQKIISTEVSDDGVRFDPASVTATEIREAQQYGGIRAQLDALLGAAKIPMQVDIGFGDVITPHPAIAYFPTLLDHDPPRLRMYPPETVIAEKLEAIATLGMANSRVKDYYDLLVILCNHHFDTEQLANAIAATFGRRRTKIPEGIPTGLSEEFAADPVARRRWGEFLRRSRVELAPEELREVIEQIWTHVGEVLSLARVRAPRT